MAARWTISENSRSSGVSVLSDPAALVSASRSASSAMIAARSSTSSVFARFVCASSAFASSSVRSLLSRIAPIVWRVSDC